MPNARTKKPLAMRSRTTTRELPTIARFHAARQRLLDELNGLFDYATRVRDNTFTLAKNVPYLEQSADAACDTLRDRRRAAIQALYRHCIEASPENIGKERQRRRDALADFILHDAWNLTPKRGRPARKLSARKKSAR